MYTAMTHLHLRVKAFFTFYLYEDYFTFDQKTVPQLWGQNNLWDFTCKTQEVVPSADGEWEHLALVSTDNNC